MREDVAGVVNSGAPELAAPGTLRFPASRRSRRLRTRDVITFAMLACALAAALFAFTLSIAPAVAAGPGLVPAPEPARQPVILAAQQVTPTQTSQTGGDVLVTQRPLPTGQETLGYAIVALAFALLSVLVVLGYTYLVQTRYYMASEKLGKAGKNIKAVPTAPFVSAPGMNERDMATGAEKTVAIEGPGIITVGATSPDFKATVDGAAAEATWTVEPAGAAIVTPPKGSSVKVLPAVAGALTLTAAVNGATSGQVQMVALAPETALVELPFIGAGYGSIVIAIVLVAGVIVLGLAGVLSGEGVATLLGGLLGYIFGVGVAGTANKAKAQEG